MITNNVIKRIQEICFDKNISYYELSKKSKIANSTIYEILNSKKINPGIQTIERIIKGLGITIADFYNHEYFK